jgi:cold shock CspA family protein
VITFASEKGFGLVDIGQRVWGDTTVGRKGYHPHHP